LIYAWTPCPACSHCTPHHEACEVEECECLSRPVPLAGWPRDALLAEVTRLRKQNADLQAELDYFVRQRPGNVQ
jgi:hypothetical protein